MKKIIYALITVMLLTLLSGCAKTTTVPDFADIKWSRSTEGDTEYISFDKDGKFTYYCACGNSVNDSDLCEGYTYDEKSETITLDCIEKTDDMTTEIIVKSYSEDELVLDFNGDVRTFTTGDEKKDGSSLEYEGEKYVRVQYPDDLFSYGFGYGYIPNGELHPTVLGEWNFLIVDDVLYVKESEREQAENFIADNSKYTWRIDSFNHETQTSKIGLDTSFSDEVVEELNAIRDNEPDGTIFFEDIKSFATVYKRIYSGDVVTATTEFVWIDGVWYWRSGEIDEKTEGWPEYIYRLPDSMASLIGEP